MRNLKNNVRKTSQRKCQAEYLPYVKVKILHEMYKCLANLLMTARAVFWHTAMPLVCECVNLQGKYWARPEVQIDSNECSAAYSLQHCVWQNRGVTILLGWRPLQCSFIFDVGYLLSSQQANTHTYSIWMLFFCNTTTSVCILHILNLFWGVLKIFKTKKEAV